MTEKRLQLLRISAGIVVFVAVYLFIFINLQLNLTGLVPSPVSTTFEHLKTAFRGTSNEIQTNGSHNPRTLVDIFKNVEKTPSLKSGITVNNSKYSNSTMNILWYNKPEWITVTAENSVIASQCTYNNCKMSTNKTDIQKFAAIIFCLTEDISYLPPVPRKNRNPDQAWIFFYSESPVHHFKMKYRHENWRNTMNWSISYSLDADIFRPYGYLETKSEISERNYSSIFHRKNKMVAWAVSHCGARSKRDTFVSELSSYGVQIDIFGTCSDRPLLNNTDLKDSINKDYKFYLSFENSLCKDYVTEKFFAYYNLDVVLIPRGGLDYDKALPKNTFINSANFNSAKELARYILSVGSSEDAYTTFLRNKDRYMAHTSPMTYTCSICEKLNKLNENRKTYGDHVTYIHKETCWTPTDISHDEVSWLTLGSTLLISFCICLGVIVWKRKFYTRFVGIWLCHKT